MQFFYASVIRRQLKQDGNGNSLSLIERETERSEIEIVRFRVYANLIFCYWGFMYAFLVIHQQLHNILLSIKRNLLITAQKIIRLQDTFSTTFNLKLFVTLNQIFALNLTPILTVVLFSRFVSISVMYFTTVNPTAQAIQHFITGSLEFQINHIALIANF